MTQMTFGGAPVPQKDGSEIATKKDTLCNRVAYSQYVDQQDIRKLDFVTYAEWLEGKR